MQESFAVLILKRVISCLPFHTILQMRQSQAKGTGESTTTNTRRSVTGPLQEAKDSARDVSESRKDAEENKSRLDQDFFDHKFQSAREKVQGGGSNGSQSSPSSVFEVSPENEMFVKIHDWSADPTRWLYLEAEASVRAASFLAKEGQRTSSFAIDRVDLSLQCPDPNSHDQMDDFVGDIARITDSDVISLDVNDFAELSEEYVAQGDDKPGSFSNLGYDVFEGYAATALSNRSNFHSQRIEEDEENDLDEDEEEDEEEHDNAQGGRSGPFTTLRDLRKMLMGGGNDVSGPLRARVVGIGSNMPQFLQPATVGSSTMRLSRSSAPSDMNRDDARLDALLDSLLDASTEKRTTRGSDSHPSNAATHLPLASTIAGQEGLRPLDRLNAAIWFPETAALLVGHLNKLAREHDTGKPPFTFTSESASDTSGPSTTIGEDRKTIVHVRDLRDLCNNSRLGDTIIRRLVKLIRKRRRSGEQIMIIGTTAQDVPGPFDDRYEDFPFRAITVPPFFNFSRQDDGDFDLNSSPLEQKSLHDPAYRRILEINLRHISAMLRRLRPGDGVEMTSTKALHQLNLPGMHFLTERVLHIDQIQRLALLAIGLSQSYAKSSALRPMHISLAALITTRSDHILESWIAFKDRKQAKKARIDNENGQIGQIGQNTDGSAGEARIERVKKSCNSYESKLLSGVVDSSKIATGFADVHAPPETIDALKTLTSLSLLRPDAFKYGVLANDRLPGLLLYGPPGTGKTLLAKAVAKESRATVLEVSGAQIYEKYVGEGEKMVRAVFSLAKKLSPCVVFIDEGDAIFGSRSNAGNRNTHREIINQFLREWDGMDDHGVFMMVASNRPFDLDDAVLRRLPRRLLVDLPVAKDRESILGIHLRNEALDSSVSLGKLAEQTPLYSGSDLKNLSVAAALACVREENDLAESRKDDKGFKLPEKRTLHSKHFDKALAEISASISEDMSSLNAIRKFDEQYGDRKGRRKKTSYGFSTLDGAEAEDAARVRQPAQSPP